MLKYRPDIDGLRAVAVLSVVFYHAGLGFPGGYVGVDVFFVISGYLITGLILKDMEKGTFSLANFWERRIRRIFPALAVMVAVTCLAGWFLLLPEDLAKLGASVIAQSLMVSNFYFWRTTNYFGGANEEKPLLHTWSLAVEEQFYLIFPIALMALWSFFNYRLKKRDERNLTTECTENTERSAGFCLGKPSGAAFSNPFRSELARDSENTSLNRSAIAPASLQATSDSQPATVSPSDTLLATSPLGDQRRWTLFWIFAAIALLSFVLSIWGVKAQPFATFFLLPTRAWELLLGSMLAVLPTTIVIRNAAQREFLCLAGLAGILVPVFFYGAQTPFPGLAALPPCLGTAVLIFANTVPAGSMRQGYFARALSWGPMVFIGLISYSLYLWHWPVICFSSYWAVSDFTVSEELSIVLVSFALAILSWKFIETPFRKGQRFCGSFRRAIAFSGALSLLLFLGGVIYLAGAGFSSRTQDDVKVVLEDLKDDKKRRDQNMKFAPNLTDFSPKAIEALPRIGAQDDEIPISFAVLGDSHAQVAIPMFQSLGEKHNRAGIAITHQGTPPLLGWNIRQPGGSENPEALWRAAFEFIRKHKIADVFLMGFWSSYDQNGISEKLPSTIEHFSNNGIRVWVLMSPPTYDYNVSRGYLRNAFLGKKWSSGITNDPATHQSKNRGLYSALEISSSNIFIDPSMKFWDEKSKRFLISQDKKLLYFDSNHLTHHGNKLAYSIKINDIFSLPVYRQSN
jgi:peptidoglycan/LPS O-acetylase OafA/YrhL